MVSLSGQRDLCGNVEDTMLCEKDEDVKVLLLWNQDIHEQIHNHISRNCGQMWKLLTSNAHVLHHSEVWQLDRHFGHKR